MGVPLELPLGVMTSGFGLSGNDGLLTLSYPLHVRSDGKEVWGFRIRSGPGVLDANFRLYDPVIYCRVQAAA